MKVLMVAKCPKKFGTISLILITGSKIQNSGVFKERPFEN